MHPNLLTHNEKIDVSVTWLARWGVADSMSLCRSAALLTGRGVPAVQARHWAQLLVQKGFAECVPLETPIAGVRRVFIATRTARLHARALGASLTDPYRLNESKLAHRLIIQRVVLDLARYARVRQGRLLSYTAETEIAARSAAEYMERWPDARLVLETATGDRRTLYVEVERNVRGGARLWSMVAGLAELLRHQAAMNAADGVLVLCPSESAATRYRAVLEAGSPYPLHTRRGLEYVASGGQGYMPEGVKVVAGWSVSDTVAESLTGAQAAQDDLRSAAAEL